ncbi:MAG: acyl-CoA dehydrogenase family protein [Pseudomonadota bacterium]
MSDTMLADQVARALAEHCDATTLREVEARRFPKQAWDVLAPIGLRYALVPEDMGGAGLGLEAAADLFILLGRHGAPVPLAEDMVAAMLIAAGGLEVPEDGVLSFAPSGGVVPWGRFATRVALVEGRRLHVTAGGIANGRASIAHEPRDMIMHANTLAEVTLPEAFGDDAARSLTALIRAAQIAGALEAILALAVDYANTRVQFGRPIGRFQAVQQQLAEFAEESACAAVAARSAARAADQRGITGAAFEIGCAKVIAGEAAGKGAAIAHQVFAAIGITEDHSLHHFTRRLWSWREEGGTERYWAQRIGAAAQARGGAALWPDITARDEEIAP